MTITLVQIAIKVNKTLLNLGDSKMKNELIFQILLLLVKGQE